MKLICAACDITLEIEDPPEGYNVCGRCEKCEGIMLPPPPPQFTMFEKKFNITHTREDY